jgi:hypothetical protein
MRHYIRMHKSKPKKDFKYIKVLLFIGLFFLSLIVYQEIRKSLFVNKNWRLNFLFYNQQGILISFPQSENEKILVFSLPANLNLKIPYNYGIYQFSSINELEKIENKSLLKISVEDLLKLKINALINVSDNGIIENDVRKTIKQIQNNSWRIILFSKQDLNLLDKIILLTKLLRLSSSQQIITIDKESKYFESSVAKDKSIVYDLNSESVNSFIQSNFIDTQIANSDLNIEILNTTDTPGAGQQFSQFLLNIGAKVISVKNEISTIKSCQIKINPINSNLKTVKYIENEFNCHMIKDANLSNIEAILYIGEFNAQH